MTALRPLLLMIVAACLFGLSCNWLSAQNYNVDKTSPNGTYRVKVEARVENEETLLGGFNESVKTQFFKGQEVIHTDEWMRKDNFELTFIEATPVIEWVGDNIIRMGRDTSDQPFLDELIVSNNTDENLKCVSVSYGRYESFKVFDLAPGSQTTLRASPAFTPDESSNYFLGYGGTTQSGKKFEGLMEAEQRKSPADGQLKFQITINAKDLR